MPCLPAYTAARWLIWHKCRLLLVVRHQPSEGYALFTWLNKQGVQSDTGFVVQCTGRFTYEYREGARSLEIEVESGFSGGSPSISISKDAFAKWAPPRPFYETPKAEQERVMQNFRDALAFQGLALEVF